MTVSRAAILLAFAELLTLPGCSSRPDAAATADGPTTAVTRETLPARSAPVPLTSTPPRMPVAPASADHATQSTPFVALPPGSEQTGPINGVYSGRSTLLASESLACPPGKSGLLEIGDRMLVLAYLPDVIFVASVPESGVMHAVAGAFVLDGTLDHGALSARISNAACTSEYAFQRVRAF